MVFFWYKLELLCSSLEHFVLWVVKLSVFVVLMKQLLIEGLKLEMDMFLMDVKLILHIDIWFETNGVLFLL